MQTRYNEKAGGKTAAHSYLYYSMKEIGMDKVTETARAKVNLTLPVLGKRPDGYHEVDTVMHSITLADTVELARAGGISLEIQGEAPAGPDNLMWRAAALFMEETGTPGAAMRLVKRLPSEAGLGGGSADAAAVLRGLDRLYGTRLGWEALCRMASRLGADVPFCIAGGCARCRGIGDVLTPLPPWPGLSLLIVKPDVSVSTAAAYGEIDRRAIAGPDTSDAMEAALRARDRAALAAALANTFEAALFPAVPALAAAASELRAFGAPVLMSGSGSAFFLLIEGPARDEAAAAILLRHPAWFCAPAETCGAEIL